MVGRTTLGVRPPLTRREQQVLYWTARGDSTRDTAVRLRLGTETVKFHRKNIIDKLNARNMVHAVSMGLQQGLIDG